MRILSWSVSALKKFPIALPALLQTMKTPELVCLQNTVLHASDCKDWTGTAAAGYTCHWANLPDPSHCTARAVTGGVSTWQARHFISASERFMPTPASGPVGTVLTKGKGAAPIVPFPGHPLHRCLPGLVMVTDHIDFVLINCTLPPGLKNAKRQAQRARMLQEIGSYVKLLVTAGRDAVIAGNFNCALSETDTGKEGWMVDPVAAEWAASMSSEANLQDAFRYFYPKDRTFTSFVAPEKSQRRVGVRTSTMFATLPFLEECAQDCSYIRSLPGHLSKQNAAYMRKQAARKRHEAGLKQSSTSKEEGGQAVPSSETDDAQTKRFAPIVPQHRPLVLHFTERQELPPELSGRASLPYEE